MTRVAVLAVAGAVMALAGRILASIAARLGVPHDPWLDPWYSAGSEDDDPDPDLETLEAYARGVVAGRVVVRP